ncbi:MAG: sugar porter family MFS transporter [Gammaproteobacteria bacterium]
MVQSYHFYLFFSVIIAGTAGLLFGFDTGNIAGALIFIQEEMGASLFECEVIVSVTVIGACVGAILSGRAVDFFGRKEMLLFSAGLFIVGAVLGFYALTILALILARAILGFAIGISSYTAPLYLSEISPPHIRGALVLINGIGITFGEAIAFLLDYFFAANENWRMMILSGMLPGIVLLCGMSMMPQSPRWLVSKKKIGKAYHILKKLRSDNIKAELRAIKNTLAPCASPPSIWLPVFRWPLIIGLGLGICQQFVGINTIMYYGPYIFKAVGFEHPQTQILMTFLMGLANATMTVVAVLIVDWVGRRKLLLTGTFLSGTALLVATLLFAGGVETKQNAYLFVSFLTLYVVGYCLSVGSLFWLIISEIFPLTIRARAMSFVTAVQWLANFIVSMTFLSLFHNLGPSQTLSIFASFCFFTFWFCWRYVPETKGLSLEQIERIWRVS